MIGTITLEPSIAETRGFYLEICSLTFFRFNICWYFIICGCEVIRS